MKVENALFRYSF